MILHRPAALLLVATLIVALAPSARSAPTELDEKRREAAALEARIQSQGERLSIADEEYNQARLDRERLETELERVRSDVADARERWGTLKGRLGERVRTLYKHRGILAESFLGAKTLADLSRGRALAGDILLTDTDLLMETERARSEAEVKARDLSEIEAVAVQKEQELEERRASVERELRAQRAILEDVNGDIAEIRDAERQRELEEAARRAAAAAAERAAAPAPSPAADRPTRQAPAASTPEPPAPPPAARQSAAVAVQAAREQLGKPYRWGAEGPDAYDCSGLTMYAWARAGVSLPHSSRAQYASLPKVAFAEIQPGDLLFYGSPIHHVGLYEGNGVMIEAPYSGEVVRRRSIYRSDFTGAARP